MKTNVLKKMIYAVAFAAASLLYPSCERDDPQPDPIDTGTYVPGGNTHRHVPSHDTVFEVAGIQFKMIYVPGGSFQMGATTTTGATGYDPDADIMEQPVHQVQLDGFLISEVEVSQFLFLAVAGFNPSRNANLDLPVHCVSYTHAVRFIDSLNSISGYHFRLPTEAEWEYVAKGAGLYNGGGYFSGSADVDSVAWYSGNSDTVVHISGLRKPNVLGIYDMSGNVMEWCSDWYGNYTSGTQYNPRGPERPVNANLQKRVVRGGSFRQAPYWLRNTARQFYFGSHEADDIGIRIVISVDK